MIRKLVVPFMLLVVTASAGAQLTKNTVFITPPPPKFTDAERQAELARRRSAVANKMSDDSLLILSSAAPRNYAGDVDFLYRQENNFYYLTNLKQKGSTFIITRSGNNISEYLFLPPRDPSTETWDGRMYSNEDATRISGLTTIIAADELDAFFAALERKDPFKSSNGISIPTNAATVYLLLPYDRADTEGLAEFSREQILAETLSKHEIVNARPIFEELRQIKSPYELKLLQHAIDITIEAMARSMSMVKKTKWEYEIRAEVEYTFRRRNANYWGFPSIVGSGPNATTLHYTESQGPLIKGDLLLMDIGAEYEHYTADITRTFPVNGKFSKEQAEIYQIVYDAQEAVAKATKPGVKFAELSAIANKVVAEGLFKLGLTTNKNPGQHRRWFMHGLGHWLGMNVHDVGDYDAPLQPGMVFTNEPGIYIRADALDYLPDTPENRNFIAKVKPAFEKYKNIGVRIEDDMLVTSTGVTWMTAKLPRKISDIEAFMAAAR